MGEEAASTGTVLQRQQEQQPDKKAAGLEPAAAGAVHIDAADIKRRCEGTLGSWCSDFHGQAEVPAVTAPRGDLDCSLDCNKVMPSRGMEGLSGLVGGAVLHVYTMLWCCCALSLHLSWCQLSSSSGPPAPALSASPRRFLRRSASAMRCGGCAPAPRAGAALTACTRSPACALTSTGSGGSRCRGCLLTWPLGLKMMKASPGSSAARTAQVRGMLVGGLARASGRSGQGKAGAAAWAVCPVLPAAGRCVSAALAWVTGRAVGVSSCCTSVLTVAFFLPKPVAFWLQGSATRTLAPATALQTQPTAGCRRRQMPRRVRLLPICLLARPPACLPACLLYLVVLI